MCREPIHTIVRKYTETSSEEEERTFPEHSAHPPVVASRTFPEHSTHPPATKTIKKCEDIPSYFLFGSP
jgi:hypothetical protein